MAEGITRTQHTLTGEKSFDTGFLYRYVETRTARMGVVMRLQSAQQKLIHSTWYRFSKSNQSRCFPCLGGVTTVDTRPHHGLNCSGSYLIAYRYPSCHTYDTSNQPLSLSGQSSVVYNGPKNLTIRVEQLLRLAFTLVQKWKNAKWSQQTTGIVPVLIRSGL